MRVTHKIEFHFVGIAWGNPKFISWGFLSNYGQFPYTTIHMYQESASKSKPYDSLVREAIATTVNVFVHSHGIAHLPPDRSTQKVGHGQPTKRCGSRRMEKWPFQIPSTVDDSSFCGLLDLGIIALKNCSQFSDPAFLAFFSGLVHTDSTQVSIFSHLLVFESSPQAIIHLFSPASTQRTASQWQT